MPVFILSVCFTVYCTVYHTNSALQASEGFQHEQWVQSVASAPDLTSLRSCLAQLEAALVTANQQHTNGSNRQQLLSPDWARVIAATPAVKGAWLQCGAEVAATILDADGTLAANMTGTAAAAAAVAAAAAAAGGGEEGADAAAAAAMPVEDREQAQQQLEQQRRKEQLLASLAWLPATAPALALRLGALDACICYPQLQESHGVASGRDIIVRYRYIVKPCAIFDPPTLEQLLLQEKEATDAAAAAKGKQQQQPAVSGSVSAAAAAEGTDGDGESPGSKQQQQGQQQQQPEEQQDKQPDKQQQQQGPEKPKPTAALDILALVHPTPQRAKSQQAQQQQPPQQQLLQAARKQPQRKPRQGVPSLDSVLGKPQRVAYGYSLQGRGLLQLIRGLPPFPDWVSEWCTHALPHACLRCFPCCGPVWTHGSAPPNISVYLRRCRSLVLHVCIGWESLLSAFIEPVMNSPACLCLGVVQDTSTVGW